MGLHRVRERDGMRDCDVPRLVPVENILVPFEVRRIAGDAPKLRLINSFG